MKTEADRQWILGEEGCVGRGHPYTGHIDFGGNGPPVETQLFWIFPQAWTSISQLQRQHLGNQVSFINPAPNVIIWYKTVSCTSARFTCRSRSHLPSTASALCLPDSPELHFGPWAGWHGDGWLQAVTPNEALAQGDSCPSEQPKKELCATLEMPERGCYSPIKEALCVYMRVCMHEHMCKGTGGSESRIQLRIK